MRISFVLVAFLAVTSAIKINVHGDDAPAKAEEKKADAPKAEEKKEAAEEKKDEAKVKAKEPNTAKEVDKKEAPAAGESEAPAGNAMANFGKA